ncbi:hypothetical protein AWZ03_013249 [Drosophila navojoa]|uniref:Uncharacterized protein n=1 Tax=Drosophila navojoa TaxID=7232 RepID=A0A484AUN7_DRONA|nr:hypothetical protein AWZ03_013249 [Drosophila navojoa]
MTIMRSERWHWHCAPARPQAAAAAATIHSTTSQPVSQVIRDDGNSNSNSNSNIGCDCDCDCDSGLNLKAIKNQRILHTVKDINQGILLQPARPLFSHPCDYFLEFEREPPSRADNAQLISSSPGPWPQL